eukprot:350955-Chlamydomonas_euryale.AAC.5
MVAPCKHSAQRPDYLDDVVRPEKGQVLRLLLGPALLCQVPDGDGAGIAGAALIHEDHAERAGGRLQPGRGFVGSGRRESRAT